MIEHDGKKNFFAHFSTLHLAMTTYLGGQIQKKKETET